MATDMENGNMNMSSIRTLKEAMRAKYSVVCLLACILFVASCKDKAATQDAVAEYAVMKVEPADRALTDMHPATIRGRQDVEIFPQVSGTLTAIRVTEGEEVRKGQTLFIIDQVPYEAELQTAVANVNAANADLSTARLTYQSKEALFRQNVISEYDLNTAKNAFAVSEARLKQAQAQERIARNNLSYTVVKSPADGVIGVLPLRTGTLVGPGMTEPLTTVSDNAEMYVYFSMTENNLLAQIRQYGTKENALKNLPDVSLRLNDGSEYNHKGKVESISGVVDINTGTVSLRATFPNPERLLHSGSTGNVLVPAVRKNVLVIPRTATYEVQDKVFVYKVVDGKAQSAKVTVTPVDGGQEYIVDSGLTAGETIVKEGAGLLKEGTPIRIKEENTASRTEKPRTL